MKAKMSKFEDEDGPDHFFRRQQPKVRPGWNRYTSPSPVRMSNSVTFFFPNKDYRDTENQGFVNPKLYKRIMPDKKMIASARRTKKRAWRKLSNRLQNEWRFRRYPRNESGKVTGGVFNSRRTKFDTMFSWLGLGNKPEGIPVEKGVHLAPDLEKGGSPTRSELPPLEAIDDRPEIEFQPLDILGFYKTADEWKASDGVAKRQLERKEPPDHVRLEDVAGQMNFLMMDKDNDESIALTVTKSLEALTKKTVTRDNKDSRQQLDAARICQIENRLKNDPSLQIEKKPNGDPAWNIPENPAELIKKKLIRTYTKIKKSGHDMSIVTVHQLEERVETLKRL